MIYGIRCGVELLITHDEAKLSAVSCNKTNEIHTLSTFTIMTVILISPIKKCSSCLYNYPYNYIIS